MAASERLLGLDSCIHFTDKPNPESVDEGGVIYLADDKALKADIHVIHSHCPDTAKGKRIFVAHGTPEHCFATAIEQANAKGFTAGDPFMLSLHRVNQCDATVTFWERHQYIWQSLCPKAPVHLVPMGVDTGFWGPIQSAGKFSGKPSLLSCENSHQIKWPLDFILAFPKIMEKYPEVVLHLHYVPMDQHRWWYPLMWANGTAYRSFSSAGYMAPLDLRNAFVSTDYYLNFVRYGDFNSICMEAKASGCKVISYAGNKYSDFWVQEGDQRTMAEQINKILSGKVKPREVTPVHPLNEMAAAMKAIYTSL